MRRQTIALVVLQTLAALAVVACGGDSRLDRLRAAETAAAPVEVLDWIAAHQVPLATTQAGNGFDDLRPLAATIGDARVVALGEATHGTREFFQLKHRMLEYLVAEKGFTTLAFEAGLPESLDVDDYVLTGNGDAARAVAGLGYWPWTTEEVVDLVEWMRAWNSDPRHTRKVHFQGVDMQVPDRAVREVLAYLSRVDPPEAARFSSSLHMATSLYDFFTLDPDSLEALRVEAEALLQRLDERRASYQTRSSVAEWTLHRQLARVAVQAITMTIADYTGGDWDGMNLRDQAMAENLEWILEQGGADAKVVLWAHNEHVSRGHFIPEYHNMGAYLGERLGDDMRVFGFAFDAGQFTALGLDRRLHAFDVTSGGPETLDGTLALAAPPLAALPLGGVPASGPVADWFASLPRTRSIGAGYLDYLPEAYFRNVAVTSAFDALLFVAQSTSARSLEYSRDLYTPESTLPAATNLDLESEADGRPAGWFAPAANEVFGYRVESNRLWPYEGGRSAVLSRTGDRAYGRNYGELRQRISAIPYRGQRVHLRAAVRALVGNGGRAHLWMRAGGRYDGMHDRPIVHASWREYDIVLDVPSTATTLSFGLVLVGDGMAALDAVSLTVEPGVASPR